MNYIKQLFFSLAVGILSPSMIAGMHDDEASVADESRMIEVLRPLTTLQSEELNNLLESHPGEIAAINRFIKEIDKKCLASETSMCFECHTLLQTTVDVVKPLLENISLGVGIQNQNLLSNARIIQAGTLIYFASVLIAACIQGDSEVALYGCMALHMGMSLLILFRSGLGLTMSDFMETVGIQTLCVVLLQNQFDYADE